jgi:glycosyltransferase involved in cell wall biosynthesis
MLELPSSLQDISLWFEPAAYTHKAFQVRDRLSRHLYPICATMHGLSDHRFLYDDLFRVVIGKTITADRFVCGTNSAKQSLSRILASLSATLAERFGTSVEYNGQIAVIPLPVDTEKFQPGDKQRARRKLGIKPSCIFVLYLGYLSFVKADLLPIIKALSSDPRLSSANIILGLAGTEELGFVSAIVRASAAMGFPQSRLRIFIGVDEDTKVSLYQAADMFISPVDTVSESFGLTPVEAMSCGVPQIVSDWDGYKETVADRVTGFRIPTMWARCDAALQDSSLLFGWYHDHFKLGQSVAVDTKAFVEAIVALAVSPDLRAQMSAASRARAVSDFSTSRIGKQYLELWREQRAVLRVEPNAACRPHCERPSYFDWFKHYATMLVNEQTLVRLSAGGVDRRNVEIVARNLPPAAQSIGGAIDPRVFFRIIGLLSAGGDYSSVSDLAESFGTQPTNSEYLRHLMWGVKYGFIEVAELSGCWAVGAKEALDVTD